MDLVWWSPHLYPYSWVMQLGWISWCIVNQVTITYLGVCLGRYADLKNNRLTNYTFNFDQMLNDQVCSLFAVSAPCISEFSWRNYLCFISSQIWFKLFRPSWLRPCWVVIIIFLFLSLSWTISTTAAVTWLLWLFQPLLVWLNCLMSREILLSICCTRMLESVLSSGNLVKT